jgi:hypothetical protein
VTGSTSWRHASDKSVPLPVPPDMRFTANSTHPFVSSLTQTRTGASGCEHTSSTSALSFNPCPINTPTANSTHKFVSSLTQMRTGASGCEHTSSTSAHSFNPCPINTPTANSTHTLVSSLTQMRTGASGCEHTSSTSALSFNSCPINIPTANLPKGYESKSASSRIPVNLAESISYQGDAPGRQGPQLCRECSSLFPYEGRFSATLTKSNRDGVGPKSL